MSLRNKLKPIANLFRMPWRIAQLRSETHALATSLAREIETNRLLTGKMFAALIAEKEPTSLHDVEFSVFSQFGDDGIIQWLIANVDIRNDTFVEFGVENYRESNTRFLLLNNNWRGLVMDGSERNVQQIRAEPWFWKYDLTAKQAFVTAENINELLSDAGFMGEIGLLHIDIDGMDYWVWKAIAVIEPAIVIVEYNALFGSERAIVVPYRPDFDRWKAHHSGLYGGASLKALSHLAVQKGYVFVGTNSSGNNAYFVRSHLMADKLSALGRGAAFVASKFRESREENGEMTFSSSKSADQILRGLPVVDLLDEPAAGLSKI